MKVAKRTLIMEIEKINLGNIEYYDFGIKYSIQIETEHIKNDNGTESIYRPTRTITVQDQDGNSHSLKMRVPAFLQIDMGLALKQIGDMFNKAGEDFDTLYKKFREEQLEKFDKDRK